MNTTISQLRKRYKPERIKLKKNVFSAFNRPLRDAGYNVIHESFLPFPSHGHQKEFVKKCGDCLRKLERRGRIV